MGGPVVDDGGARDGHDVLNGGAQGGFRVWREAGGQEVHVAMPEKALGGLKSLLARFSCGEPGAPSPSPLLAAVPVQERPKPKAKPKPRRCLDESLVRGLRELIESRRQHRDDVCRLRGQRRGVPIECPFGVSARGASSTLSFVGHARCAEDCLSALTKISPGLSAPSGLGVCDTKGIHLDLSRVFYIPSDVLVRVLVVWWPRFSATLREVSVVMPRTGVCKRSVTRGARAYFGRTPPKGVTLRIVPAPVTKTKTKTKKDPTQGQKKQQ